MSESHGTHDLNDKLAISERKARLDTKALEAALRDDNDWLMRSRLVGHEMRALETGNNILRAIATIKEQAEEIDSLRRASPPSILEEAARDWVLVPREATEAMWRAAQKHNSNVWSHQIEGMWRDMVAAAIRSLKENGK